MSEVKGRKGDRVKIEKVINPLGSCAGAGSGEFHLYRRTRRTEMKRLEQMEKAATEEALNAEFQERVEQKRKECEERTAKNAQKRKRRKQNAKLKQVNAFANDGSFLEKAKALLTQSSVHTIQDFEKGKLPSPHPPDDQFHKNASSFS